MSQPWDDDEAKGTSSEGPVSISQTIKLSGEHGAPWLVTRGPDASTIKSVVDTSDFRELIVLTAKQGRYAHKAWSESGGNVPVSAPAASSSGNAGSNTPPKEQPNRTSAPNGEEKFCKHGQMTYREGVNKSGKAYKGFFCPSDDRDAQCKPEWAK